MRAQSTSAVWEAARKAREAARKLSALPNEDRNDALERMAKALENGKADIEKANALDCEKAAKPEKKKTTKAEKPKAAKQAKKDKAMTEKSEKPVAAAGGMSKSK